MNRSITPTIEGGLLVAITVILGLVTVYVPILGFFVEFFYAVPLAILTARQGAGKGLMALFVTFILLSMLITPILATRLVLSYGICGVALGWGVKKELSAVKIFLMILIAASAGQVLTLALLIIIMDVNFIETQLELLREAFNDAFSMYESMGVDKARINEAKKLFIEPTLQMIAFLIPTILMLSAVINAVAVWYTSKWTFPKVQLKLPSMPPFAEWRFPTPFFYLSIVSGLGMYWSFSRGWTQIQEVSFNLWFISMSIALIQGLALLSYVFEHYKASNLVRWIVYLILLFNMFLLQVIAIAGLVDILFDYRKRLFKGGD